VKLDLVRGPGPKVRVRLARVCLALVSVALASPLRASAQDALSVDAAVDEAMTESPTLRAAVLASRSAERLVVREEGAYPFRLTLDATGSVGNTPQLSPTFTTMTRPDGTTVTVPTGTGLVTFPYTQSIDLGAALERALPWGMTVSARLDAIRTYRAVLPTATSRDLAQIGPGYGFNLRLGVTQSLLRGFGEDVGYATLRQARADRDATDAGRDRSASALLRDVLVAYWELWFAERVVQIQEAARDVLQRQLEDARTRTGLGALAGADALSIEAQVASAESAIASAELTARTASITLARLLGRTAESLPSASEAPSALGPVVLASAEGDPIEEAPEVIEARARIESARVATRIAGQSVMPVLDVGAEVQVLGLGYDDVGQTLSNFGSFTAVQFLGTLTYQTPLDDVQLQMDQARAALAVEAAEASYDAARAAAVAEARAALESDRAASRRVELSAHAVELARRALAAQEERRALGAGVLLDVLAAAQTLRQAELDLARAEVDAQEARVRWLHLRGELLARYRERVPE
jgi:outer membrane protein